MKKLALAVVLVLALAIPAFANPFVDVPLNHWAYDAVQSLAARGVIIGYPDGTFGGNRALTRYEFAMALARAIGYMEMYVDELGLATQEDIAILERLIQEFADELRALGLTVDDLARVVGEHSQALRALDARVSELERFASPLLITGEFSAGIVAYMPIDWEADKVAARWVDSLTLNLMAEINPYTVAGAKLVVEDTFGPDPALVSVEDLFIEFQKDAWYVRAGEIMVDKLDLGLVLGDYQSDAFDLEFTGFHVVYAPEDSDITWRALGTVNDFYSVRMEWEQIALGVHLFPEHDQFFCPDQSDIVVSAFGWTDFNDSDVYLALEGAYGALSGTFGVAGELGFVVSDDVTIALEAQYLTAGFTPALPGGPSAFDAPTDELIIGVGTSFRIAGDDEFDDTWTLGIGYKHGLSLVDPGVVTTQELTGTITYLPADPYPDEQFEIEVTYDLLQAVFSVSAAYVNYPLTIDDDHELILSADVDWEGDTGRITAVGGLTWRWLEEGTAFTLEGRYDSLSAAQWSALAELEWQMEENTKLTLGYEFNTWDEDERMIIDQAGTITAELTVSF